MGFVSLSFWALKRKNLNNFFASFLLMNLNFFASLRFLLPCSFTFFVSLPFRFNRFVLLPFRFEFFVRFNRYAMWVVASPRMNVWEYSSKINRLASLLYLACILSCCGGVLLPLLTSLLYLVFPPLLAFLLLLGSCCCWHPFCSSCSVVCVPPVTCLCSVVDIPVVTGVPSVFCCLRPDIA